jgi:hypothetical protein
MNQRHAISERRAAVGTSSTQQYIDEADGRMSGVGSGMQVRGDASAWELQAVWRTAKA